MHRSLAVFAILLPLCGLTLYGEDWAQFRGPNRDGHSQEENLLARWPADGPKLLWTASGLGEGYSSASIANGRVYLAGRLDSVGYLFCFDLKGKQLWKSKYGPETSGMTRFPGSRSTPTINDGRAYLLSGLGTLYCFDLKQGELSWSMDILDKFGGRNLRFGMAESLLIDGDNLICTPGGPGASVVALNKTNGKLVWKCAGLRDLSAYCSPRLFQRGGTRLLITLVSGGVVGIDANSGKLLWRHAYRNRFGIHPISPVIRGDHLFTTSGYGHGGLILKLSKDGTSVSEVWRERTFDTHHGGVVLLDKYVYGTSDKRPRGQWMCANIETGKILFETRGIGKGCVIAAGGLLYGYGENGILALIKPSPKGLKTVSSIQIDKGSGQHWAHPSISDGRLYLRHGHTMMVYDIRAQGSNGSRPKDSKKKKDSQKKKDKKTKFYE